MMRSGKSFVFLLFVLILGMKSAALGQEPLFKEYPIVVIQELDVPSGNPAPATTVSQMAERIVNQLQRYSQKFNLFEAVVKEGGKEIPADKKVLLIKGTVKEFTQPTLRRRIGRSLIPGGEFTGSAAFSAHYQFIDRESGKVVYETDLRTTSTGSNDTVEYAMERNGEALAKLITKYKGK